MNENSENSNSLKLCKYCNQNKLYSEFNKGNFNIDGLQNKCKQCEKEYYLKNKKKISEREKMRYLNNKKYILDRNKKWQKNNKEKENLRRKNKYHENPELGAQKARLHREKRREHYRKYIREWMYKKRHEDPNYMLGHRLRNRILCALKSVKDATKAFKTVKLIGCSIEDFKKYLESQFVEGMSWDKFYSGEIVVDHIKPCCSYDLTDPKQQLECFNYKNMRPFWALDNWKKTSEDKKISIL